MLAALHLHSTWSDGELTLAELREIFLAAGCRILAVTDHAESMTQEKLANYIGECERLSDERMLLVPSLEFSCREKMHILGYGVTRRHDSQEPEDIIRHIEAEGGVPVIAHPKPEFFTWIPTFDVLPQGIEVWNSKYDGRHAPRPETFRLVTKLRERKPDLHGFYGIDLHWRTQFRDLHVQLEDIGPAPEVTAQTLLDALRAGRFVGRHRQLHLPSHAQLPDDLLHLFGRRHRRSQTIRRALVSAKRMADAVGARAPERLKAQLRRFF